MSKAESIMSARGDSIKDSASHRPPPAAMPTIGVKIAPLDSRLIGLIRSKSVYEIPTEKISVDPDQPRKLIDEVELANLAESIRLNGLLHPIGVRYVDEAAGYRIIYGERRFRAFLRLGKPSISATTWDGDLTPAQILTIQLAENLARQELRPIEQARKFRESLDLHSLTQAELAGAVGVSEGTIAQSLRLLDLPEDVQVLVASGGLAASSAYELAAKVEGPELQRELAAKIVSGKMNRAQAKALIDQEVPKPSRSKATSPRAKGRGAKGKPPKLPTERTIRVDGGLKVVVSGRKGFDVLAWVEALRHALEHATAELKPADEATDEPA